MEALKALSDSDFDSNKDTTLNIYECIIYFCGVPVSWKAKA